MRGDSVLFAQSKQAEIVYTVVRDIMRGRMSPGQKLPSQKELCQQLNTTPVTVSRAIQQLIRIGLARSRERQGVFVSSELPRFPTYGIVFPTNPENPSLWNRFFGALHQASVNPDPELAHAFSLYYDIDGRLEMAGHRRLMADISAYRLMGVVFASSPWLLGESPLVQDPSFPRVAFMPNYQFPGIPAISLHSRSFLMKALDYLQQERRRRIAVIASGESGESYLAAFRAAVEARGMRTEPYWLQSPSIYHAGAAASIAHLLFHASDAEDRPDGLVIADDNFIEPVERGVIQAGVSVPGALSIVAHCNFPSTGNRLLPIRRIGFDAKELLRLCADHLDAMHRGEEAPHLSVVEPKEEEATAEARSKEAQGSSSTSSSSNR